MKLTITVLSENAAGGAGLLGEWGLSILVETDESRILLDTGQSISAAHNAARLGIDLGQISRVVLSHSHYDHTGGLARIVRAMKREVEVIAHPSIWAPRYNIRDNGEQRKIGIPFTRRRLEKLRARFNFTEQPVRIARDILTTGEIPLTTDYEHTDPNLYIKSGGGMAPDAFPDDQALIITTKLGLAVVLGCAHRGMINTLNHARKLAGIDRVYAVIGGSHLYNAPEDRIWATIDALKRMGVEKLGLCHCTGDPVCALFAGEFGERFLFTHAGTKFDLLGG